MGIRQRKRQLWRPSPAGWRVILLALLVLCAVFVAWYRIPASLVELRLNATQLEFEVGKSQLLTPEMPVSFLTFSGDFTAWLPPTTANSDAKFQEMSGNQLVLEPRVASSEARMLLNAIVLGGPSRVELATHPGALLGLRVSSRHTSGVTSIDVTLDSAIDLWTDSTNHSLVTASPLKVQVHAQSREWLLSLTPIGPVPPLFPISDVSNLITERVYEPENGERFVTSTVTAGEVYFVGLGNRHIELSPNEVLRFSDVRGSLRILEASSSSIRVAFIGEVKGMSALTAGRQRSLMPTLGEWLIGKVGVHVFWTFFAGGLAFLGVLLNWWGRGER